MTPIKRIKIFFENSLKIFSSWHIQATLSTSNIFFNIIFRSYFNRYYSMLLNFALLLHGSSQAEWDKIKLCWLHQQVFFLLSTEGSLVNKRDLLAVYLGGTYCQRSVTRPPSCVFPRQPIIHNFWSQSSSGVQAQTKWAIVVEKIVYSLLTLGIRGTQSNWQPQFDDNNFFKQIKSRIFLIVSWIFQTIAEWQIGTSGKNWPNPLLVGFGQNHEGCKPALFWGIEKTMAFPFLFQMYY